MFLSQPKNCLQFVYEELMMPLWLPDSVKRDLCFYNVALCEKITYKKCFFEPTSGYHSI